MERRFSKRILENLKCTSIYLDKIYNCNIIDVSRDGLALYSIDLNPKVGDDITVRFTDMHRNKFYGHIVCNKDLKGKVRNVTIIDSCYRIGVSLSDLEFLEYIDKKQAHLWYENIIKTKYNHEQ